MGLRGQMAPQARLSVGAKNSIPQKRRLRRRQLYQRWQRRLSMACATIVADLLGIVFGIAILVGFVLVLHWAL